MLWWIWKVWIENWWLLLLQKAHYSENCHAAASVRSDNKNSTKEPKIHRELLLAGKALFRTGAATGSQSMSAWIFFHNKIRALEADWFKWQPIRTWNIKRAKLAATLSNGGNVACLSTFSYFCFILDAVWREVGPRDGHEQHAGPVRGRGQPDEGEPGSSPGWSGQETQSDLGEHPQYRWEGQESTASCKYRIVKQNKAFRCIILGWKPPNDVELAVRHLWL